MKNPAIKRLLLISTLFFTILSASEAQRYLSDYDSTLFIRDTVRPLAQRFSNIHISGYIQPQFQVAQAKGAESYSGGNFPQFGDNRFMLRRARMKIDYRLPGKDGSFPAALFTFQFEATERDVNVRDMFIRVFEPARKNFSLTAGLFARPYGFEVNLSSAFRESPERGRMSQILMPSERDLGAMLTYESQSSHKTNPLFKFDIGVFNGQGKSGPAEFDAYKDLISRLSLKPLPLGEKISLGAGFSFLNGGWVQATRYKYEMGDNKKFMVDSSLSNIGGKALRQYFGGDMQLALKHGWGRTELRSEYWRGTQPGTVNTTTNPGVLPVAPTFIRKFDGAFFYFLQNLINQNWELVAKYDWYDPNIKVAGNEINQAGNFGPADIRYTTVGFGITRYFNPSLKFLIYYEHVRNELSSLAGFESDKKDNIFTFRMQLRF